MNTGPSFNPETGLLYAPTMHRGGFYKHLPVKDHVVGQRFQFIENRPTPVKPGDAAGHIEALDPLTGQPKWRVPLTDHPVWSAIMTTGGGLLFTGKETGEFPGRIQQYARAPHCFGVESLPFC